MDLKDVRIFSRVAAVQSLSAVASELGVSAGTISKRIQSLEKHLRVRLIDRTTRSCHLTEEGRIFLQRAERILHEMDRAQDEIGAHAGHPAGRLKISAPATLQRYLIAPALVSFAEAFPAIEVCVDITDRIANLHEQGYDATIRTGTLSDCNLIARRLALDPIILVAAPRYIERHGAPQRPDDVSKHVCLLHGDLRSWTFHRGKESTSVRVNGRLSSDSGEFLHLAALQGLGLLRSSELAVSEDLEAGRLIRLMPEHELARGAAIYAIYPNAKQNMPRLHAFREHMADFCRDRLRSSSRKRAGKSQMGEPATAARLSASQRA